MHLTNQYLAQLPEAIRDGVLGNVGTVVSFAVSAEDAGVLSKEFAPKITELDFINLSRFNFYIKLMIDGKTSEAFSGMSLPPQPVQEITSIDKVMTLNRLAYGWPKLFVEEMIKRRLA